ncbi:ATP-binding protein [Mesotoga sp. HF07.pep.5.2.highcov]|uniref:ATP-binding protein n=1 Tax=Mesotoga sp. HF07.pep.5.2.highcov TaxID=1462923 RepID=UPI000EF14C8B|nr:ATP-binding protein [Mesotoga sp. HF07.pep.5.2.highcov]
MKPFHTVAIPHEDIKSGALEMSVFAADLWNASRGKGPQEYSNPDVFFRKTYQTDGLKELLETVQKRLEGRGGDSVLQVQTPFGGGKTHSMIALYHKAGEWNAKRVVLVGTVLDKDKTLWGEIERQLTGEIRYLTGRTSPGREALNKVLTTNAPVLILMDELMGYMTKPPA